MFHSYDHNDVGYSSLFCNGLWVYGENTSHSEEGCIGDSIYDSGIYPKWKNKIILTLSITHEKAQTVESESS